MKRAAELPSISPRLHARDPRAVASGRLGGEEESPAGAPSEPAPVPRFVCARCHRPIRRNPILRISFCEVCGLSQAFIQLDGGQRSLPV